MRLAAPRVLALHVGVVAALGLAQFVVGDYALFSLTQILVFATYAMGYNLLYGYAGLLSLGHAMFFGLGLYVAAIGVTEAALSIPEAMALALAIGFVVSAVLGAIILRASGVAFMIVTLMFSQAAFLTVLYFGKYTRGDEGIVIADAIRRFSVLGVNVDLASPALRYNLALGLFAATLTLCLALVGSRFGRVLVAIRENESRTAMLGYDVARYKLVAFAVSGTIAAAAGASYALMFAYAGSSLASIQYSIQPLLWTLLGGAGTALGPLVGTALMYELVDVASSYTSANLLAVGAVLIGLVLFFPKGLLGEARRRWAPWLP